MPAGHAGIQLRFCGFRLIDRRNDDSSSGHSIVLSCAQDMARPAVVSRLACTAGPFTYNGAHTKSQEEAASVKVHRRQARERRRSKVMTPSVKKRLKPFRLLGLFVFIGALTLGWAREGEALVGDPQETLRATLVSDGFHPSKIDAVYARGFTPQYRTIAATFRLRESKLNYAQFLQAADLERARQFAARYRTTLQQAEASHGVDSSVIVAILLVETRFGSYTGQTPVLHILSSFALMDDPGERDRVWALLSDQDRNRLGRESFDERLLRRARWAYQELCALIRMGIELEEDVSEFKGSVMGAMGWAQFLPTSYLRFGYDGDSDGRVDLFQPSDAIFSVANYLRGHGWNEAMTREEKEKVIHAYNKSQPYVDTVLALADRLR